MLHARARLLLHLLLLALFVIGWLAAPFQHLAPPAGASRYRFSGTERCLMRKVNSFRARHGRSRLKWDKQLGYVGRVHAQDMARSGSVYHDPQLGDRVTRWSVLGQNTGSGAGCLSLFRGFKHSQTHRSTMLGRWRFLGVGAYPSGGLIYVQSIFEHRRDPGNIYHYP